MSKFNFSIIAAALIGAGNAITTALKAAPDDVDPSGTPEETPEKPAAAKRGRPAAEKAPEPVAKTEPVKEPAVTGKTYEQLRELIQPLVEAGQGDDVKKTIAKYGAANLRELSTTPEKHAAFEKDISALSI